MDRKDQDIDTLQILPNYTPPQRTQHSFFFTPVTEDEVISTINSLNTNSAPGLDNFDNRLLKEIKLEIAKPLTHIINQSFENGNFPSELKKSLVIPIYKSGDQKMIANYRPITLISNFAKIIEKIVKNKFVKYLEKNKIISENQFGFRDGRGTHDVLFKLTNCVTNSLDEGERSIVVFLDLAKAFDTVSHGLLLKKLEAVGVRGVAYDWFHSYLSNRTQTVKIDSHVSNETAIDYGVF